jgi:hypothetical protein
VHYAIYRSTAAPYFAPAPSSWLADVTRYGILLPSQVTYPDPDAGLSVAGNTYFYVVTPVDASGAPIGSANRTGAFVFGLTPGN